MQQALITWVDVDESLPPLNHIVLIHRVGGQNNHNDVGLGYRKHKWGTSDEWEWVTTGYWQTYWWLSCDGSRVAFWTEKPQPPVVPNVELRGARK